MDLSSWPISIIIESFLIHYWITAVDGTFPVGADRGLFTMSLSQVLQGNVAQFSNKMM